MVMKFLVIFCLIAFFVMGFMFAKLMGVYRNSSDSSRLVEEQGTGTKEESVVGKKYNCIDCNHFDGGYFCPGVPGAPCMRDEE